MAVEDVSFNIMEGETFGLVGGIVVNQQLQNDY